MQDSGAIVSESERDGGEMLDLIDAGDNDCGKYPAKGESLVARRALSAQMSVDNME